MIRFLFVLLFLKSMVFACSLCSVYTPKTHVTTSIKADKTHIKTLHVNWSFAAEFTKELLQLYDLDLDASFNEKELKLIEGALISYLEPKNFLTKISYDKQINEKSIPFEIKDYKMMYKNSILSFEYNIDLNYKLYDKNILNIHIFDNENYFFIIFDEKKQLLNIPYKITKETNINDVSFTINDPSLPTFEEDNKKEIMEEKLIDEQIKSIEEKQIEEKDSDEQVIKDENLLDKFTYNVKKYLVDIEKGEDNYALFFLLMASFLYGVLHALGPGHGKALAFSYFSAQKSSYFEAFVVSLGTAFVHIIGALVLVLVSVFVLESVLNKFMEDSISYITSFSALIIMLLALYILYRKIYKKTSSCCACNVDLKKTSFSTNASNISFVKTSSNKPIIDNKIKRRQNLIFVLTAGIIPCPGTVLLFVYAFLLKTYFSVFLASIAISIGMAVIIFASSFLGVSLGKVSAKSEKIKNTLEIVAPIFMFVLGLLLFFSTNII